MYLNEFKDENVKKAIVDLCHHSADANGIREQAEIELIKGFCTELNTDYYNDALNDVEVNLKTLIDNCSLSERKKVVIELLAIMMSDGQCDDKEMIFLKDNVVEPLGIKKEELDEFYSALRQLYMVYARINSLVA